MGFVCDLTLDSTPITPPKSFSSPLEAISISSESLILIRQFIQDGGVGNINMSLSELKLFYDSSSLSEPL
ncbi:MAG: hypothetical protein ACKPFD_13010 [Dolichospermum sp.]